MEENATVEQMWHHSNMLTGEGNTPTSPHMDFHMIYNPKAGNALDGDHGASFSLVELFSFH